MNKAWSILAIALLGGAFSVAGVCEAAAAGAVSVVEGGTKGTIIVPAALAAKAQAGVPARAPETLNAALELSDDILKMTGRRLPVVAEGRGAYERTATGWTFVAGKPAPAGKPEIHVGWTARALKEADKARVDKLDMDGFLIKTTPEAIFLVGPKDWSTAYAVYTFLEEFCGVRWFMPGEMGEDVPQSEALSVPIVEKTYQPAYLHRQYSGLQFRDDLLRYQWGMHQKVRARLEYHHNLFAVFDVKKYGEKYPELYPVLGGQRRIPGPGNYGAWQPCLSNPKAVDVAMEYARDYFKKNPDAGSISLGINDGGGYCECPECMKLVTGGPRSEGRAVWFFQFANKVAERFDKEFPDKQIGYLLYGECHLPSSMKVHPRLIGFEVYPSFRLIVPGEKQKFDDRMAELQKVCPTFGLYDWYYGYMVLVPRLQVRQAKYWLQHGYEMGARHVKSEAYMNWALDGFKYWIHTKLMWDPSLDVDPLMEEFCSRFFKESAEPMREYFKTIEKYTVAPVYADAEKKQLANFAFRNPIQFESFPPEAVKECEPLLDKAEKAAQSDLVRRRVQYYRMGFNVSKMLTLRYHLIKEAMPFLQQPATLPQGMPLLAQALGRDFDVERFCRVSMGDDAFAVRRPEDTLFSDGLVACRTAATTLNRQIQAGLQGRGAAAITPATVRAVTADVLEKAWAGIKDPETLAAAHQMIAPAVGKIIVCNKAPAPKLDGLLDDEAWKNAQACSDFSALSTGKPAKFLTEVRACHDGRRLYLSYRCVQDTKVLLAWTHGRDDRVWREDGVEFLINKLDDTAKEQRRHVMVSTQGHLYDYADGKTEWNPDIQTGIRIEPDGYTIEVSLPLADAGIDPVKDRFLRFNMIRNVYARDKVLAGNPLETSAWYLSDNNPSPDARGWLIFNN